jgi:DNA modification methylase
MSGFDNTRESSNRLHYGDAQAILKDFVEDGSVDLVYLDPDNPSRIGIRKAWEISASAPPQARGGTHLPDSLDWALQRLLGNEPEVIDWLRSLYGTLTEVRRVLSLSGSVFLQTDTLFSPYARILMDYVFGREAFRNEIVWEYRRSPRFRQQRFPNTSARILFYAKAAAHVFFRNERLSEDRPMADLQDRSGVSLVKPERLVDSEVWRVSGVSASGSERLGYPGQDPVELLRRIIMTCSPDDATVLDPYCGTGTTLIAAEAAGRKWIGIDHDYAAITLVKHRLAEAGVPSESFEVYNDPVNEENIFAVAKRDPRLYELWVLGTLGARPTLGRGADRGFDGQLLRQVTGRRHPLRLLIEVKSRDVRREDVERFENVLGKEGAELGLLVGLHETSPNVLRYLGALPTVSVDGQEYPQIQLLTVGELLSGRRPTLPAVSRGVG